MKKLLILVVLLSNILFLFGQSSSLPIMLTMPFDKDTIKEKEPNFVWQTNITTVQNDPRLQQQIVVVKLAPDQSAAEAISQNDPIFIRNGVVSNSITYSSPNNALEEGETYAWQVTILNSGSIVQSSEVFQFTLFEHIFQANYLPLRAKINTSPFIIEGSILRVSLLSIKDLSLEALIQPEKGDSKEVSFVEYINGEAQTEKISKPSTETRFFELDLKKYKLKKGKYVLTWSPVKGENYELLFEQK